jgi:hypothetical protein
MQTQWVVVMTGDAMLAAGNLIKPKIDVPYVTLGYVARENLDFP